MDKINRMARARALGALNMRAVESIPATSPPEEINQIAALFPAWRPGAYETGDKLNHEGIPYHCVQAHDSEHNPDWTPDTQPALFAHYHGTDKETARPFVAESQNPYQPGHWALWPPEPMGEEDNVVVPWPYECLEANVVWSPEDYPQGWQRWEEPTSQPDVEPGEDDAQLETDPGIEPYEVGAAYEPGDLILYDGIVYRVAQVHTSAAHWPPNQLPALYAPV